MTTTNQLLPDERDFARMETELFGRLEHSHTRQVRRHRLVAAASIVLLATGGVAGVTEAKQSVVSRATYCYSGSNTNSQYTQGEFFNHGTLDNDTSNPNFRAKVVALAVQSCAAAWTTGVLGSITTAPPLQACVRNDQVIAVFSKDDATPAAEFCDNLGMSAP